MYKIYINDIPLILCDSLELNKIPEREGAQWPLISRYNGKKKFILQHVDMLEKGKKHDLVVLYSGNINQLIDDFESLFKIVPAGGGVVLNEENELLMIFRRGRWDLPKGKLEKDEAISSAAVREVMEETGLTEVSLRSELCQTRHFYRTRKDKRAIKLSYWFVMDTKERHLVPQEEEDIEMAKWMNAVDLKDIHRINTFPNIIDVIELYLASED